MGELFDVIDEDRSGDLELGEWMNFFCTAARPPALPALRQRMLTDGRSAAVRATGRNREAVPRPTEWDPDSPACAAITGYIFDCDGTLYQPSGPIPGAGESLSRACSLSHTLTHATCTPQQHTTTTTTNNMYNM